MTLLTTAFAQGTHAARPAASSSNNGFYYYETDTTNLFQSTGAAWQQIASTGGGSSPLTTKGDIYGHSTVDARIPVGTDGQVLTADSTQTLGVKWATPSSGSEIGYDQITAPVNITATSEASSNAVITCSAHTFDGAAVMLEFFAPYWEDGSTSASQIWVSLFESTTQITRLGSFGLASATLQAVLPVYCRYRFTPAAGSHTYIIAAHTTNTTGTPQVGAGSGGTGGYPPAFARFSKV